MKILILFGVIFLTGCPLSQEILLFNNSGSNAEIVLKNGEKIWPSGGTIGIADKSEAGVSWDQLIWRGVPKDNYYPVLTINCGEEFSSYDLSVLYSYDEIKKQTGNSINYRLQLEKSCDLYMLTVGTDFGDAPLREHLFRPIE
jgi:hypothetical protein